MGVHNWKIASLSSKYTSIVAVAVVYGCYCYYCLLPIIQCVFPCLYFFLHALIFIRTQTHPYAVAYVDMYIALRGSVRVAENFVNLG